MMKIALTDCVTGEVPSVKDQQVKKEKRPKIPKAVEAESFQEEQSFSEALNERWDGSDSKDTKPTKRRKDIVTDIHTSLEEIDIDSNSDNFLEQIMRRTRDSDDDDPFAGLSPRSR